MEKNELKYLAALNQFSKFGPQRLYRLKTHFQNYENAFKAGLSELSKAGIDAKTAQEFIVFRDSLSPEKIMEMLEKENINILAPDDGSFPSLLREIHCPPQILYCRGLVKNDFHNLAVVGSRKHSPYGRQFIEKTIPDLVKNGIAIVSGLAVGIDTLSHNACLDNKGYTIAVLGTGLDRQSVYPSANRYLADKIVASGGLVVSEFPPGTPPLKFNFPQRNRIISGLSFGSLVVEAGEKSGSLITAQLALEQNREVFAVPGNIFSSYSAGCHYLIKQGAKTVTEAADILESLDLTEISTYIGNKLEPENEEEAKICEILSPSEPLHIDEIIRKCPLGPHQVSRILTMMEMRGLVKNVGNMKYIK